LNNPWQSLISNSWIELAARWILGLTFLYASSYKILSTAEFAKIVYGYDLFPAALINLIAIIVPFMELIAGHKRFAPGLYRGAVHQSDPGPRISLRVFFCRRRWTYRNPGNDHRSGHHLFYYRPAGYFIQWNQKNVYKR
jgi:hypothetical protein